jgi:hypothetical protein
MANLKVVTVTQKQRQRPTAYRKEYQDQTNTIHP